MKAQLRNCVFVILLTSPAILRGQVSARPDSVNVARPRARLLGVFDEASGEPVPGVQVRDSVTGAAAITTSGGTVNLQFSTSGTRVLALRKPGYAPQSLTVAISATDSTPITVVLKHIAELPAVVTRDSIRRYVSPGLRAFDERRRNHSAGYFVGDSILRKDENRSLASLLQAHAAGAAIKQGRGGTSFLVKAPSCSNGGPPDVYLDGAPIAHLPDPRYQGERVSDPTTFKVLKSSQQTQDGSADPIDLSQFRVSDLAGVEFYPRTETVPVQYSRSTSACGVLLLWTRER
jgi:hypothetical protein